MPRYIIVDNALNAMCDNCDSVKAVCPHYPCKQYSAIERIPFADVVDKALYKRLLENSVIIAAALNSYQSADMVEVIRCRDCKWKQGSECTRFADVRPFPDDYCSRGERKEAEDE